MMVVHVYVCTYGWCFFCSQKIELSVCKMVSVSERERER